MSDSIMKRWPSFTPQLLSLLRIAAAFAFMQHGMMKLFAWPSGMGPNGETVELLSQFGAAGILETFGGALLLLGLFTRPVAFLVAGEMAVAYFQFNFPRAVLPTMNGGEAPYLFCFIWFFFSAAGAGPWSLDAILRRR